MTDYYEDSPPEIPPEPPGHGRLLVAGAIGALALGAGLGFWARPAAPPQPDAAHMAPEDAPRPALQIVVDDSPAPIGALLEVLPGDAASAHEIPPAPRQPAEPVVPRRPTVGLMKVDAVVAAEPLLVPAVKVEEKPKPKVAKAPEKPKVEKTRIEKPKFARAKAEPKPEKFKVAEAKPKKVEKPKAARDARVAQIQKAKAERLAKAEKAQAVKLAQVEAKREKAAEARAETRRLASLVKVVKPAPRKLKADTHRNKAELAQARPTRKPGVEKASTKPAAAVKAKPPAPKTLVIPRGEGPMRVARNNACASADPGETAVCADRRLGARDRQLQQAYRNAEAAGVPASALRRQQARWLQARAAAAREAPWAVEDVYEARISELNDLTRDAREN